MVHQLGDNNPERMNIGLSATEKFSAYGVTPVVQPASVSQAVVSGSATATTTVLREQLDETIVLVNQLRSDLIDLGWIKGAA